MTYDLEKAITDIKEELEKAVNKLNRMVNSGKHSRKHYKKLKRQAYTIGCLYCDLLKFENLQEDN